VRVIVRALPEVPTGLPFDFGVGLI